MSDGTCQIAEARTRILGGARPGDPEFEPACQGSEQWHNFPTLDTGDRVPFFLCEGHRAFLRSAKQARLTRPE
jgi:hypothetical protein